MTQYTIHVDSDEIDLQEIVLKMELGEPKMRNASKEQIYTAMVRTAVRNGDEWIDNVEELRLKEAEEQLEAGDSE